MKRIVLFLGILLLALPARAQYLDGLPAASAVASADIIPVCQGGTAGHPGTCTTRKATALQLNLGSLLNTNLDLGTGTLTAAGATFTGPLHMGANLIDGSNIAFTGGSFTGLSSLGVTGNATLSGTLTTGTGVTNGLLMSAATLSVTGTGNPAMVIKGLGTGGINFQTGATPFSGLLLLDGGASAVNALRVVPGTTGNGVSLQAVGDVAAVLNFKAGTGGTAGSIHSFIGMQIDKALYQPANIVLAGAAPAPATTSGIFQTINLSGNDGATPSNAGVNEYILNDTANIKGLGAQSYWLSNYNAGADGSRIMMETVFKKIAPSASGNQIFLLDRKTLQALSDEGGTGDTITASQVGTVLTVTAAPLANLRVGSIISGPGLPSTTPFETIGSLGTGTGGTGTYNMSKSVALGSQSMTAGNYKGSFEDQNQVMQCTGAWYSGCQMIEWDLDVEQPVQYKQHLTLSYSLGDAAHGVWVDCALCISENLSVQPGTGGGKVMLSIGTGASNWPIDTLAANTAVLRAQRNLTKSAGINFGQQYKATYGVDFSILNCGTACWSSPGFLVDGDGSVSAGPLSVAYASTGATISAPGLRVASAVITAGGTGYQVNEQLLEPISGSMWQVTTVSAGGVVTAMSLLHSGYPTSCPAAATPFADLANGTGLKATLTCDTSNGIVLAAASDKLGFYGATAIVKATPAGACAGNTGCQALRDALGNLGLINTGSITN